MECNARHLLVLWGNSGRQPTSALDSYNASAGSALAFFRRAKVELRLAPLIDYSKYEEIAQAFQISPPRELEKNPDMVMKEQDLIITGRNEEIERFKVKVQVDDGEPQWLIWPEPEVRIESDRITIRKVKDDVILSPDEDRMIPLWFALKTPDKVRFWLNTQVPLPADLDPEPYRLTVSFSSSKGRLRKPLQFTLYAYDWETLRTVEG